MHQERRKSTGENCEESIMCGKKASEGKWKEGKEMEEEGHTEMEG